MAIGQEKEHDAHFKDDVKMGDEQGGRYLDRIFAGGRRGGGNAGGRGLAEVKKTGR